MTVGAWGKSDLDKALENLSIVNGDIVFLHSNIGFSGICNEKNPAATVVEGILEQIGSKGSLFLPAFTYSFPEGRIFDSSDSSDASAMGALSIYAETHGFQKSRDPIFGVLGKGQGVQELFRSQANRSFGPSSLFSKLLDLNVKMLSINAGAGGTIVHEMEYRISVPYRFEKQFRGKVQDPESKAIVELDWISYVRDLANPSTEADFLNLTKLLYEKAIWKKFPFGKGYLSCANSLAVLDCVSKSINENPRLLLR